MTRAGAAIAAAVLLGAACRHAQKARPPEAPPAKAAPAPRPAPGHPPVPAMPQGLLQPEAVRDLQRALAQRGYLHAHREGELDEATSSALLRFQQDQGLAATGFPDRETLTKLGMNPEQALGGENRQEQ